MSDPIIALIEARKLAHARFEESYRRDEPGHKQNHAEKVAAFYQLACPSLSVRPPVAARSVCGRPAIDRKRKRNLNALCLAVKANIKRCRYDEALVDVDRALAVQPDSIAALIDRGNILARLGRHDEALASYDRVLAMQPDNASAHFNKSFAQLAIGDWDSGWREYEWRWKIKPFPFSIRNSPQPLWLGENTIKGKTILLYAEQGFGDTIQLCRYAPLVAARGARVLLYVDVPLRELMASLAGVAEIIQDKLPHFDLLCPLFSLPLALGTRIGTIPADVPYLAVSSERIRRWKTALGSKDRPHIGLVWSGNPDHENDTNRSISLQSLLRLLDCNANFVSLQQNVRPADAAVLKDRSDILHLGDKLETFADTAAAIANLDLVISVDTSVAHLAGALAKPVWILLPFVSDWRWLLDRENSPWYPTARLFRQSAPRDWSGVIGRVVVELDRAVHAT